MIAWHSKWADPGRVAAPSAQPGPVLHQHMPLVAELGFVPIPFAGQPRFRIGRRLVRGVRGVGGAESFERKGSPPVPSDDPAIPR